MNLAERGRQAITAIRKGLSELGGGAPFGPLARFPALLGWGSTLSDAQMEVFARGATTAATCVGIIAERMAEPDLLIEVKTGKRKWDRLDEDATDFGSVARVFQHPNPHEGKTALWTKFYASEATFGRSPLLTDYLNFGQPVKPGRTFPRQLRYLYAPNLVSVFDGRTYAPTLYRYADPVTGENNEFRPDEILLHLNPRLDDPFQGASLLARCAVFAVLQREMGKYHIGYFRNGARAGAVLESDKAITKEQMKRLRVEWQEEYGNLDGKAFMTWFLHSGFKLKELGAGQKDADFPNLFRLTKEEIGGAFGIPPVFLNDYSEAALANIEEQTPILYEGRLMPTGKRSCENLTEMVGPRFDPLGKIRFRLDWDNVPAVRRMRLKQFVTMGQAAGAPVVSRNDMREMANMPPDPNGNGLLVPFSMTDRGVGAVPDALTPESGNAPKPKPEAGAPPADAPPAGGKSLAKWIDSAERHAKRLHSAKSMDRFLPSSERDVRAFLAGQEQRVLAKLPAALKTGAARTKDDDGDVFDVEFESQATAQVIARVYARVASTRGPEAIEEVGSRATDFLMDAPEVVKFLRENGYKMGTRITETTGARISTILSEAATNGTSLQDVVTEIRALYDVRRSDAATIARTEVSRSYNFSTHEAWTQSGAVEGEEWLTSEDDHVRDSHAEIDGEVSELGEAFSNGCLYPGDPDAAPDETINCRCVVLPVLKSEERGYRVSPELAKMFSHEKG